MMDLSTLCGASGTPPIIILITLVLFLTLVVLTAMAWRRRIVGWAIMLSAGTILGGFGVVYALQFALAMWVLCSPSAGL